MTPVLTRELIKIAIKGINNPITKKISKTLFRQVKKGDVGKSVKTANKMKEILAKQKRRAQGLVKSYLGQEKTFNRNLSLRRELYYNPHTKIAGQGFFSQMKKTPMIDLDFKGASHYARNTALQKYFKTPAGKKSLFATYDTPGGIRLFDLARRRSPRKYYNPTGNPGGKESGLLNLKLGGDPDYAVHNIRRGAYSNRVSPKPGRDGDFVARFVDYLGDGVANPKNLQDIKFHDDLIKVLLKKSDDLDMSISGLFDLL